MQTQRDNYRLVFAMIGALVVPATLTLLTIKKARDFVHPVAGISPYGYTWSLLLFIVPFLCIVAWLYLNHDEDRVRKSFWVALAILVPLGFILDLFFGLTFFTFRNPGATLQIYVPGYVISEGQWEKAIPIEEFIFYISGFLAVLSIYLWCDEYWLGAYQRKDYMEGSKALERIIAFHPKSIIWGVVLIVLGILYKKFGPHPYHAGLPGYFIFLVCGSFIPSAFFFRSTYRFINWRAFSLTFFFILLVSLVWEATLAAPYQWWGYHDSEMLGILIGAWCRLPIEAVMVWMAVSFTTVIIYEAVKIWMHSGKSLRQAFLGSEVQDED